MKIDYEDSFDMARADLNNVVKSWVYAGLDPDACLNASIINAISGAKACGLSYDEINAYLTGALKIVYSAA